MPAWLDALYEFWGWFSSDVSKSQALPPAGSEQQGSPKSLHPYSKATQNSRFSSPYSFQKVFQKSLDELVWKMLITSKSNEKNYEKRKWVGEEQILKIVYLHVSRTWGVERNGQQAK